MAPENTLASFQHAIADGADILETDLHVASDGTFVCIHDGTLDRTTDGTGAVESMTIDEIRTFSAGMGRAGYGDERVPALADLLPIIPEHVGLLLELKSDRFLEDAVAARLVDELKGAGILERTAFISFHLPRVHAIDRVAPGVLTGVITVRHFTPRVEATLIGPLWPLIVANPAFTWWARRRGMFVAPLDVTPRRRLWLYRLLRCDAVIANDPGEIIRALRR